MSTDEPSDKPTLPECNPRLAPRDHDITRGTLVERHDADSIIFPPEAPGPNLDWERYSVMPAPGPIGGVLIVWRCVRRQWTGECCSACGTTLGTVWGQGFTVTCRCGQRHLSYLNHEQRMYRLAPVEEPK